MQMIGRCVHSLPLPAMLALAATTAACARGEPGPQARASQVKAAASSPLSVAPAVRAGSDDPGPAGGPVAPLLVAPGEWSESKLYKFRLERVAACAGEGSTGRRPGSSWVGAYLTVHAKQPEVFVTPRDLELRRGGVILNATYVNPPRLPGCEPLLVPKQLRPGDVVAGFAVFEVPASFRVTTDDPIVLSYRPTRWGGARRAEVPIRECLDACGVATVSKRAERRQRAPLLPGKIN